MRFPGLRRDHGDRTAAPYPDQVVCPVCRLQNDPAARFCRNCGLPLGAPRDPVRGTTSRRADLPSEHGAGIAALVGLAIAVVLLGGAAFLILRNNNSGGDGGTGAVSTTPAATGKARQATPAPAATRRPAATAAPGASIDAGAVATLPPRIDASPSPDGGNAASSVPATPGPLVGDTDFVCGAADFLDPTRGTWNVSEARWGGRDKWDELTIVLRKGTGKGKTDIAVEQMPSVQAAQVSGLDPAPTQNSILITFDGDVSIKQPIVARLNQRQLSYLNVEQTDLATYAVVGINRPGTCYRMWVPSWKKGDAVAVGDTVTLLLDIKYR
jgi:hypothetical protein